MKQLIVMAVMLLAASTSHATIWCDGAVKKAWINANGNVYVNMTYCNAHTQICNVDSIWKGVPPSVCKEWYKTVMTVKVTEESLLLQYNDYTCATLPVYGDTPAPNYVMAN